MTAAPSADHRRILRAAVLLLVATNAQAHFVSTGWGTGGDAAAHLVSSPEALAPLVGLALLSGMRSAVHARWTLFAVSVAWPAGVIALPMPAGLAATLGAAGACLGLGGLVAADLDLPPRITTLLAVVVGLGGGAAAGSGLAAAAGCAVAVFVLVALAASVIVPLRREGARLAVRVAGSWLAAFGLLTAGWALR